MMQGTTPCLLVRPKLRDLTTAKKIVFTIKQGARMHEWSDRVQILSADEEGTILCIHLTQEETLAMRPGIYRMQVSWIDQSDQSRKTLIGEGDVLESLHKGVIVP